MSDESKNKSKKLPVSAAQAVTILTLLAAIIAIFQFVTGAPSIPALLSSGTKPTPAIQISPTLAPTVPPTLVPTATPVATATPSSSLASLQRSFQNSVNSTILSLQESAHQPIRYNSF